MDRIARPIEWISEICGAAAVLCVFGLTLVTMYEVVARYVLRAPTLWAFDVAYMLNGAAFVLGCAVALKYDRHVAIDILTQSFSRRLQRAIEIVVFSLLVLPAIGFVCLSAWDQFWEAWVTGELEQVSPWQPKIWPFRLTLAVGLSALWLQVLGRILTGPREEAADPSDG